MTILHQSSRNTSSRTAIDTLAWLIEDAFQGDPSHSLLANLRDLRDDEWTALLPGAGRTIAEILEYVGWCKCMKIMPSVQLRYAETSHPLFRLEMCVRVPEMS